MPAARHQVFFAPAADRQLRKMPETVQRRIVRAVEALESDPGAVKLHGDEDFWRIRVGDYRVIYQVQDDRLVVLVVRIGHRRDVYRKGN